MAKVPPLGHHKEPGPCVGFFVFGVLVARRRFLPPSSTPTQTCYQDATLFNAAVVGAVYWRWRRHYMIRVIVAMNPKVRELLGEPSTWRGIALLITAAGIQLSPDQVAAITSVGLAVTGFIGAFCRDKGGQ